MKVLSSIIAFSALFFSCKTENNKPDDEALTYKYFEMENRGWKSKLQNQYVDDINFTATEVPVQYFLLQDLGPGEVSKVDSLYTLNKEERIIEFEFTHEEEKDLLSSDFTALSYEDGIKYLSFEINKDFYIVSSKNDTIACSGVLYERNFKVAPFQRVILFFSGVPEGDNIQLVYNDNLYRKGIIKFRFKENISNILL
ncbi:hypothetical protein [Flavobacterium rhizosphaerae]|uniref:DUF4738 domain-containing protein n=1 Tax=Flavobacterium rhizosphaerae TaxID=3163298 RepID=A0ABW8YWK7_9FLAO